MGLPAIVHLLGKRQLPQLRILSPLPELSAVAMTPFSAAPSTRPLHFLFHRNSTVVICPIATTNGTDIFKLDQVILRLIFGQ